ncbi:hypothetical protein CR513_28219, partial [Mucuna pruriens]
MSSRHCCTTIVLPRRSSWKADSLENADFPPLVRDRVNPTLSHLSKPESYRQSGFEPLHVFDPEIERTLYRLRNVRHTITPDNNSSNFIWNSESSNFTIDESISFSTKRQDQWRTMKEL